LPGSQHTGRICQVCYPPDGKTLRTLDDENTLCLWDAATLRLLRRTVFPSSYQVLGIRRPDGKYVLCRARSDDSEEAQLKVIDAAPRGTLCRLSEPGAANSVVLWPGDHELLIHSETQLIRIDFLRGRVVSNLATVEQPFRGYSAPSRWAHSADFSHDRRSVEFL